MTGGVFFLHKLAATSNFQQCGILINVDSDEHTQPPLSVKTPNHVQSVA